MGVRWITSLNLPTRKRFIEEDIGKGLDRALNVSHSLGSPMVQRTGTDASGAVLDVLGASVHLTTPGIVVSAAVNTLDSVATRR